MGKNNKTNYLDYFKEQIDWESVLTLMKFVVMTNLDDIRGIASWSFTIHNRARVYTIEKDNETISIKCSDGRSMRIDFKVKQIDNDKNHNAAYTNVVIGINEHSDVSFESRIDWIDEEYKALYLDLKDADEFKPIYDNSAIEGFHYRYDVINDDIVHLCNDSWNTASKNDKQGKIIGRFLLSDDGKFIPSSSDEIDYASIYPTLEPTLVEIDKFRERLAQGYIKTLLFTHDELSYLIEMLWNHFSKEIEEYRDNVFYKKMDEFETQRKEQTRKVYNSIMNLLPDERTRLLASLTAETQKDQSTGGAKK